MADHERSPAMDTDLDTFLTAAYTAVDTFSRMEILPQAPPHRGPTPQMSDSAVLTLVVVGQGRGSSERALLRWADAQLRAWFPVQLSQSAFNRRVHHLGPILTRLLRWLADQLGAADTPYQIADTTPVPLARQCRGERQRLFADTASIGRGGSDRSWDYGVQALLLLTAEGAITGFVLAPAATQDRWPLEAALSWRQTPPVAPRGAADLPPSQAKGGTRTGPTGPCFWPGSVGRRSPGPILADTAFAGDAWEPWWDAMLAQQVVTPVDVDPGARRTCGGWRQVIETVNSALAETWHLPFPKAKTDWGVVWRVAAKCAAFNLGIGLNRWLGRPDLALTTLFPA
jgi:hypothetical protein